MITIRIKNNSALTVRYFCRDKALTAEEKKGAWIGKALEFLGLNGEQIVDESDFKRALNGIAPNGICLNQRFIEPRRAAWDMVVTPDKSISIASFSIKHGQLVRDAHAKAIRDLLVEVENLAARRPRSADQTTAPIILPTGLAVASFTHLQSRWQDPHLHTHLIILNTIRDSSRSNFRRQWIGLEPSPIYRAVEILNRVYQRELCRHLQFYGFKAELSNKGIATLPIPKKLCDKYSQGRTAIMKAMEINPPPKGCRPETWANVLNDRTRPKKGDISYGNPFNLETIESHIKVTLPPIAQPIPQLETLQKKVDEHLLRISFIRSKKNRLRAALEASLSYLHSPFSVWREQSNLLTSSTFPSSINFQSRQVDIIRRQALQSTHPSLSRSLKSTKLKSLRSLSIVHPDQKLSRPKLSIRPLSMELPSQHYTSGVQL